MPSQPTNSYPGLEIDWIEIELFLKKTPDSFKLVIGTLLISILPDFGGSIDSFISTVPANSNSSINCSHTISDRDSANCLIAFNSLFQWSIE